MEWEEVKWGVSQLAYLCVDIGKLLVDVLDGRVQGFV